MSEQEALQAEATEPNGETAIDWEAKYKEAVSHSRDWEKKAKANKAAADELNELKQSQMSEQEKLQSKNAELEKELSELRAEKDRATWIREVSSETGVSADLLALIAADSKEALLERAKTVSEQLSKDAPKTSVPVVLGSGKHVEASLGKGSPQADFNAFMKEIL